MIIGAIVFCAAAVRTAPQLINKLKEGINVDALKTLSLLSERLFVPTPMGVSFTLNVSTAAILKLEGMVKANSLPELSDFLLRRPYMNKKIEIMTDIKPRYNGQLVCYFQIKQILKNSIH